MADSPMPADRLRRAVRAYWLAQYSARSGMSSARSRSGGTRIGNTLSRKKRSERNLPSRTASSRFRLVAATTRASVRSVSLAAHALELALLQHAQEGDLDRRRQLADLVEEDRASGRQLEPAPPPFQGTREGPPLVAEQLRGDEPLRQGRTVDLHQGAPGPRRACVDRAGDELLAGPGLAA